MKKNTHFFVLFFVSFLISSCSKELSETQQSTSPSIVYKVKTYTEDVSDGSTHLTDSFNLKYDDQSRLVTMVSVINPGNRTVYAYSNNNLFTMDLYNSNQVSIHADYYLNNAALIDSSLQFNDTHDSTTEKYTYNSNKQLMNLKRYDYIDGNSVLNESDTYTYNSAGYLASETDGASTTTYEYYAGLVNTAIFGTSYNQVNNGLVKTSTIASVGDTVVQQHVYAFDDKKRVIKETITDNSTSVVVTKSYTYY